jgi:ribokinase
VEELIAAANIVMLQLEIPIAAVDEAIRIANQHGTLVVLDPAPATAELPVLQGVDYLTPNEHEAASLTGISVEEKDGPSRIARTLRDRGVKSIALTLGKKGCYIADADEERYVAAKQVTAVDSTGAGDTFNGFFSTALARNLDPVTAASIACVAASLSVTRSGARANLPGWDEVQATLPVQSE